MAATGERAIAAARSEPLSPATRAAMAAHEQELTISVTDAHRYRYMAVRSVPIVLAVSGGALIVLAVVASRVAGHLARQLSRPLDELVGWTDRIAHALPLPAGPPTRGAPEFAVLRNGMRVMAADLDTGRARALEAERLRAFRETARQVAHELKNPLTPIRLAVTRLQRDASPALADTVDVLATESARLEAMAHSFSLFGRLPEGPPADVDLGELARYTAKAAVPSNIPVIVDIDTATPLVRGHYDALARALSNILLNAADACAGRNGATITLHVTRGRQRTPRPQRRRVPIPGAAIVVRDSGSGIAAEHLAHVWEPYVTHKAGGTGLGMAIARQTIEAHDGTVELQSVAGQGTEVRFTLPVAGAPLPTANGADR